MCCVWDIGNAFGITGPFVRGIHMSLVGCPLNGPVMKNFDVFFVVSVNKLLNSQFGVG